MASKENFFPALLKSIRQLCSKHYSFEECIEVVGLLCLEIDKKRKESINVNELVKSNASDTSHYVSKSHSEQNGKQSTSNVPLTTLPQANETSTSDTKDSLDVKAIVSAQNVETTEVYFGPTPTNEIIDHDRKVDADNNISPSAIKTTSALNQHGDETHGVSIVPPHSSSKLSRDTFHPIPDIYHNHTRVSDLNHSMTDSKMNCSAYSESEPSFEVDVENTDTSQEIHDIDSKNIKTHHDLAESTNGQISHSPASHSINDSISMITPPIMPDSMPCPPQASHTMSVQIGAVVSKNEENLISPKGQLPLYMKSDIKDERHLTREGPLDMSFWRPDVKQEIVSDTHIR